MTNNDYHPSKEDCLGTLSRALAAGIIRTMSMDPHEAALGAYLPGGPSVEELEATIRHHHELVKARTKTAA